MRTSSIDPYTPEELKAALREQTNDPLVSWTGKHGIMYLAYRHICELERQIDQLQNEVNAVEWVNGRIEKELFECRRRT